MTGNKHRDATRPWHQRTSLLLGASVAALTVIGLLYFAVSSLSRHYNQPPPAPTQYIGPPEITTATARTTTTAATSTSTVPVQTSEIDNPSTETSGETTTGSSTDTSSTPTSVTQSRHNHATDDRWPYPLPPNKHTTVLPNHQ